MSDTARTRDINGMMPARGTRQDAAPDGAQISPPAAADPVLGLLSSLCFLYILCLRTNSSAVQMDSSTLGCRAVATICHLPLTAPCP